jgi:hypothetical protein
MPEHLSENNKPNTLQDSFTAIVLITIYAYAANYFSYITADPDLWGHIKFGEEIWRIGHLPATDSYSYTANGLPWVNHEWLAELIFYFIFIALGSTGLLACKLLLGIVTIHLLTKITLLQNDGERFHIIYMLCFLLIIPVLAPAFMVRPHLMTIFFMTLLVVILQKFFDGNLKSLAWSPLLMLIWVNCHGGVVAGIGIYGAVTVVECIRYFSKRENDVRTKKLLIYFCLSCLALLINPYGWKLWLFLYQDLTVPRLITEWQAIPLISWKFLHFKILTLLLLATLLLPTRKEAWQIIVLLIAVFFGFKEQRHSVLPALIMAPYLYRQFAHAKSDVIKYDFPLTSTAHMTIKTALILFTCFQIYGTFFKYQSNDFKILVEPNAYPVHAVRFMNMNGISGKIQTPFDWGEYLIWKMPTSKVSVDGRFTTAYPRKILEMNQNFSMGRPGWKQILEEFPPEIILTAKNERAHRLLMEEKDWIKVYEDPLSMIFLPKTNPPGAILEKFYNKQLIDTNDAPSFAFP